MTKLFLLMVSLMVLSGCAHRKVFVAKDPVYDYGVYPTLVSPVPVVVYGGGGGYHHGRHHYRHYR